MSVLKVTIVGVIEFSIMHLKMYSAKVMNFYFEAKSISLLKNISFGLYFIVSIILKSFLA
jgi:hypothetical protein